MTEIRFQDSEDRYRSCKIEQLDIQTGNFLTKMEAFAAILRRIQSFCVELQAEHLAMAPTQGSCWFSGLLKPAGFNICDCERYIGDNFQLCSVLPTPPIELPARGGGSSQMDDPIPVAAKDGLAREMPCIGEAEELGDSTTDKAMATSNTARETRQATKIADKPDPLSKKVYCMFWIRKGECDYMQGGCKYKHEMPVDEETRQRIGLREIPQWFKESPGYEHFLQQGVRKATETFTGVRSDKGDTSKAQSSSHGSDSRGSRVSSHRRGRVMTTSRDPAKTGSCATQSPHEDHRQSTVATNNDAKQPRTGPSYVVLGKMPANPQTRISEQPTEINISKVFSETANQGLASTIYKPAVDMVSSSNSNLRAATRESTKAKDSKMEERAFVNSTTASNETADRGFAREMYKPPVAMMLPSGSNIRAAGRGSSNVNDSKVEERAEGQARRRFASRIPASAPHSRLFQEAFRQSRSAAPSVLPGSTKRRPSSPVSDANFQRAGPGLKRARMGKDSGRHSG